MLILASGSDKRLQLRLSDLNVLLLSGLVGQAATPFGKASSSMELLTSGKSSGFIIFINLSWGCSQVSTRIIIDYWTRLVGKVCGFRIDVSSVTRNSRIKLLLEALFIDRHRSRWTILYISLVSMSCVWDTTCMMRLLWVPCNHSLMHTGIVWHLQRHHSVGSRVIICSDRALITWWR